MAIDEKLKGQIKKDLLAEKKADESCREHSDCEPYPYKRKIRVNISEAANGWTLSAGRESYIATDVDEVAEILTALLEASEEIKED